MPPSGSGGRPDRAGGELCRVPCWAPGCSGPEHPKQRDSGEVEVSGSGEDGGEAEGDGAKWGRGTVVESESESESEEGGTKGGSSESSRSGSEPESESELSE